MNSENKEKEEKVQKAKHNIKECKQALAFGIGVIVFLWLYVIVSWYDLGGVLSIPLTIYTVSQIPAILETIEDIKEQKEIIEHPEEDDSKDYLDLYI